MEPSPTTPTLPTSLTPDNSPPTTPSPLPIPPSSIFSTHKILIPALVLTVVVLTGLLVWKLKYSQVSPPEAKACTEEAKLCPDGSAVGRTGPNCEFAECPVVPTPTTDPAVDWKIYTSVSLGFSFKYPSEWEVKEFNDPLVQPGIIISIPCNAYQENVCPSINIDVSINSSEKQFVEAKNYQQNHPDIIGEAKYTKIDGVDAIIIHKAFKRREGEYTNQQLELLTYKNTAIYYIKHDESYFNYLSERLPDWKYKIVFDQILSTFKFLSNQPSCSDIQSDTPELTYLQSFCSGNGCTGKSTKADCEAVDVVTIENGKLSESWGQDGIYDCVWIENAPKLIQCQPKYK